MTTFMVQKQHSLLALLAGRSRFCLCSNCHSCSFTSVGVTIWLQIIREQSAVKTRSMFAFAQDTLPSTKCSAWYIAEVQR